MGFMSRLKDGVQVTHLPTGTTAVAQPNIARLRSMHRQKAAALDMLRAKLFVLQHPDIAGMERHEYEYNLPDDVPYPHDLAVYKSRS